ncbi:MAG: 16S rRNA (guanine(527)-N(7))-methyltransferase RsmG [Monoglobus pectinilyticus]
MVKHFLDSILPLAHIEIKTGANIADVGTGAGFPGLPIKIIRDDINLTLIDSLNKRINFLTLVSNELNLSNTVCVHGRAEDLSRKPEYREKFDYVISRAVANMTALSEYCLPYIKPGGMFIALKAEGAEQEVDSARAMICNLGGRIDKIIKAPLPNSDIVRSLIVIKKVKPTPKSFPRTSKKIKQQSKPVL